MLLGKKFYDNRMPQPLKDHLKDRTDGWEKVCETDTSIEAWSNNSGQVIIVSGKQIIYVNNDDSYKIIGNGTGIVNSSGLQYSLGDDKVVYHSDKNTMTASLGISLEVMYNYEALEEINRQKEANED